MHPALATIVLAATVAATADAQIRIEPGELSFDAGLTLTGVFYVSPSIDLGSGSTDQTWDFTVAPGGYGPLPYQTRFLSPADAPAAVASLFPAASIISTDEYATANPIYAAATYLADRTLLYGFVDGGGSTVFDDPLVEWQLPLSPGATWTSSTTAAGGTRIATVSAEVDAYGVCRFGPADAPISAECLRVRTELAVGSTSVARYVWIAKGHDGVQFVAVAFAPTSRPSDGVQQVDSFILMDAMNVTPVRATTWAGLKALF